MPKSLDEILASPKVGRPTFTDTFCIVAELAEEWHAKVEELGVAQVRLEDERERRREGNARLAAKPETQAEVDRLAAEVDALAEEMAEHEIEVAGQASSAGDWNRFKAANPPREKNRRDFTLGHGVVDFDALVDAIPQWLTTIQGEEATAGKWTRIADVASPKSLDDLATKIIEVHEAKVVTPKARAKDWLAARRSATDSASDDSTS